MIQIALLLVHAPRAASLALLGEVEEPRCVWGSSHFLHIWS